MEAAEFPPGQPAAPMVRNRLPGEKQGEPQQRRLLEVGKALLIGISQSSIGALSTKRAASSRWVNSDLPMASTEVTWS